MTLSLAPICVAADSDSSGASSTQTAENKGKEAWNSTVSFLKAAWNSTSNAVKGFFAKTKEGYEKSKLSFSEWLAKKESKSATPVSDSEKKA